jgi:ribulose-phosphate 3-epimerase
MNLFDSSFLCLDIGSAGVSGIAHRIKSGRITKSAFSRISSDDTIFALKSVLDELERQIGTNLNSAYITGNFGKSVFSLQQKNNTWDTEHRITPSDIRNQTSQITPPDEFYPMHIIPLRYDTGTVRNLLNPVGTIDRQLSSLYGTIFYDDSRLDEIHNILRAAHIQMEKVEDPSFILNKMHRDKNETALFIDLGAEFTSASIWTGRGPVFHEKINRGQSEITARISDTLGIGIIDADRIKCRVADVLENEMDRFTPRDTAYDFSRADINEILLPNILDIISQLKEICNSAILKYTPSVIYLSGGGSSISDIDELIKNTFDIPVKNLGRDAAINALWNTIWQHNAPRAKKYISRSNKWENISKKILSVFARKKKKSVKFIPIMPSTLSFNMSDTRTYDLFRAGNISMIHCDIMDGFFVSRIAGGIDELKFIRKNTNAHLHVHLMTESPAIWAQDAANAGADTIILSTNTAGVRAGLRKIKELGKRAGIALSPETPVSILKPVLKELDEILIMSVKPGAGGQVFDNSVLHKIRTLANTRKKYGLKYKISVDGGINPQTAMDCWTAGADFLVCGTYLARAADFPLAVMNLLPNN